MQALRHYTNPTNKVGYYNFYADPLDQLTADLLRTFWSPASIKKSGDRVRVDSKDTEEALYMWIDVPGYTKDDVVLETKNQELTLRVARKEGAEGDAFRAYEAFTKSWTLPETLDLSKIAAKLENGVLEITIPKCEEAKPKLIAIS